MEIKALKISKNPASIVGSFLLMFIGIYLAMSTQMSISKDTNTGGVPMKKEIPRYARVSIGLFILLIGIIIFWTHMNIKKQD